MTFKDLEDIRSWRRGEWVADITEIESMVYGLVDELDRLRAAADGLESWLGTRRDDTLARSDEMFNEAGTEYQFHGGQSMAFNEAKIKGRELGLWD